MSRIGTTLLAAIGAFVGLAAGAAPAHAQICGDLFDECAIAVGVHDLNAIAYEDIFPVDESTCEKITKRVEKQCEDAIKTAAQCWKDEIKSVRKTSKLACKTQGSASGECNADFKEQASNELDEIDALEDSELPCCGSIAADFYTICVGYM